MELLFKPDLTYETKIYKFLSQVLGPDHVILNKTLFRWFYHRQDKTNNKDYLTFILAVENKKIISLLGFYEVNISLKGEIKPGVWAALWFSDPKVKKGIGGFLMKRLMDEYEFVGALACSKENQKIAKVLGFEILDGLNSYVYILNKDNMGDLTRNKLENSKRLLNPINQNKELFKINSYSTSIKGVRVINKDLTKFTDSIGTYKDQAYLDWRYNNHPFFKYEWTYLEYKRSIKAWFVWREAKVNNAKLCRIVDFDIDNFDEDINLLLNGLINQIHKREINYIDLYTTNKPLIKYLLNFGFINNNKTLLPSLIDPVTNICPLVTGEFYINFKKFYRNLYLSCFRGDGDIDRPNNSIKNSNQEQ